MLREEIVRDPAYTLQSAVELQLSSEDGKTYTRSAGNGICTLSREGLTYVGTKDGEAYACSFTLKRIFRLIFDAGKGFQVHDGSELLYFVLDEGRSAVDWYVVSGLLYEEVCKKPLPPGASIR